MIQARKAIVLRKSPTPEVETDLDILTLSEAYHCLPTDLLDLDPDWIWKMKAALGYKQEAEQKQAREANKQRGNQ